MSNMFGNLGELAKMMSKAIKEISLTDEALKDRALLEEQILVAANSALAAAKATAQEKMNEVTGGLGVDMPGIF